MDTALRWLKECVVDHGLGFCPKLFTDSGPPALPHRVLSIIANESQDVKLEESEGSLGYYACLSHCWGENQPLTTTKETLAQHKINIPWASLPRTFQDAIIVAREIGIHYIWIDSLCIVQDDEEDWQVESILMGQIYGNSAFTIAGSVSSGADQGLFRTSDSKYMDEPLQTSGGHGVEAPSNVRCRTPLVHDVAELPLLQRAWVYQERLLSPRFLHFGQQELIWECRQFLACECGGMQPKYSKRLRWPKLKMQMHPGFWTHVRVIPHSVQKTWHTAVQDYSRMELSRPSDLFPAVSGIARLIEDDQGWTYVAGLWKETFITDLLWKTAVPQKSARCQPWRAPTFSWASVIAIGKKDYKWHIAYDMADNLLEMTSKEDGFRKAIIHATVEEINCEYVGEATTGQLSSCSIVLRGTLVKAHLYSIRGDELESWYVSPIGDEWNSRNIHLDVGLDSADYSSTRKKTVYCLKLVGNCVVKEQADQPLGKDRESLYYLVLDKVASDDMTTSMATRGSQEPSMFVRVGLFRENRHVESQIETGSEESNIQRDVLVKIV